MPECLIIGSALAPGGNVIQFAPAGNCSAGDQQLSSSQQSTTQSRVTAAERIGWAILIVVTLSVCYFSNLGVIGFVGPDEPRYAWITRDMLETGDWVTPRLYGKPWFEKPVLYYWSAALSFKLFGVSEAAARLPSALSALFATLALGWLAWRTCGEECARWLLLLLPTSVGMIGFSHAASTDMPFAGMLTIALVCAAVVLGLVKDDRTPILPKTPWLALVLFGFFLGLAVLAKGPAAVILSGGAVFSWALSSKRWRDAFRLLHPVAIASFCLTALPWYILCARRNPEFFRVFIIEHNFKRYLTPEFQHVQPFWYYAVVLVVAFLPWTFLLLAAAAAGIGRLLEIRKLDGITRLALCWSVFCLVFFTISKSKLPGYILPAFPPIAFLLARTLSDRAWFLRRRAGYALIASGVIFLVPVFLASLGTNFASKSPLQPIIPIAVFGLYSLATILLGLCFLSRPQSGARFVFCASSMLAVILLMAFASPTVKYYSLGSISGKSLAESVKSEVPDTAKLRTIGYRRDFRYALNFYLHREIPDWTDSPVSDGYVLSNSIDCDGLKTTDDCKDTWGMRDQVPGGALLRVTPKTSLDGLGGSGRQTK